MVARPRDLQPRTHSVERATGLFWHLPEDHYQRRRFKRDRAPRNKGYSKMPVSPPREIVFLAPVLTNAAPKNGASERGKMVARGKRSAAPGSPTPHPFGRASDWLVLAPARRPLPKAALQERSSASKEGSFQNARQTPRKIIFPAPGLTNATPKNRASERGKMVTRDKRSVAQGSPPGEKELIELSRFTNG